MMRTCDNTQYFSLKTGDVKQSFGRLYAVPCYSEGGNFRGVISAIVRSNVLEAMLLGVPFMSVTDEDRVQARELGRRVAEVAERLRL